MYKLKDFMPEGVADIYCEDYEIKEGVISDVMKIFQGFGYRQVLTPTFEYYDLYAGIDGTIDRDEMFKFIDSSGKIMVLRPDATIPIARMAALNYESGKKYSKYSYAASVFRNTSSQYGLKKEFMQAGIEYLGNSSPDADGEIIYAAIKSLLSCGFQDIKIDLGHAGFFKGLIKASGLSQSQATEIKGFVENKNFAELSSYLEESDVEENVKNAVGKMIYLYGNPEEVGKEALDIVLNSQMEEALENLRKVYEVLKDYGCEKYISFDLGLVNHINYYTGVIFKGYISSYGRDVLSGGRYDNLAGQYGCHMPSTGFAINIDEVLEAMNVKGIIRKKGNSTDYMIIYYEESRQKALALSADLRDRGFIVETDSCTDDMGYVLESAGSKEIKEIINIGKSGLEVINLTENCRYTCTQEHFLERIDEGYKFFPVH